MVTAGMGGVKVSMHTYKYKCQQHTRKETQHKFTDDTAGQKQQI